MKQAIGEADLTLVAIILIAVVAGVASPLINYLFKSNIHKTCCAEAGGRWADGICYNYGNLEGNSENATEINSSYRQCLADSNAEDITADNLKAVFANQDCCAEAGGNWSDNICKNGGSTAVKNSYQQCVKNSGYRNLTDTNYNNYLNTKDRKQNR